MDSKREIQSENRLILIDSNEWKNRKNRKVIKEVIKNKDFKVCPIETGDYQVIGKNGSVVIERKTVGDWVKSISDGRTIDQSLRMLRIKEGCVKTFVIEGDWSDLNRYRKKYKFSENSIKGMLETLIIFGGISVVHLPNNMGTAKIINGIYEKLGEDKKRLYPIKPKKKYYSMDDKTRAVLEAFPTVGAVTSDKLLKEFGTLKDLFVFALGSVTVGIKVVDVICGVLNHKYGEKE